MGITIENLPSVVSAETGDFIPSMRGSETVKLTVGQIIDLVLGSAPGTLDTLEELAAALGDDANFAATVTSLLAGKADKVRTVAGGGLATGGGDLSANRTITVTKASDAEHEAMTRDDVASTPKGIGLALAAYTQWEPINVYELSAASELSVPDLSAFKMLRIYGDFTLSAAAILGLQISSDNGSNYINTGYEISSAGQSNGVSSIGLASESFAILANSGTERSFFATLGNFNAAIGKRLISADGGLNASSQDSNYNNCTRLHTAAAVAANALKILPLGGGGVTMTGTIALEGVKA